MRTTKLRRKTELRELSGGWNWKLPKTPTRGKWVFEMVSRDGKMNWIVRKEEK